MFVIVAASVLVSIALSIAASRNLTADLPAAQQEKLLELAVFVPMVCATLCASALAALLRRTTLLRDEMARLAVMDPLTEVNNRRGFFARAKALMAAPVPKAYSLFVVDLDHFKHINDAFGHDGGDKALAAVGGALNTLFGVDDAIGRMGGEEFAVLAHTDDDCAPSMIAEAIREVISSLQIPFGEVRIPLTASIGFTSVTSNDDLDAAFGRADRALYRAKEEGRNRAVPALEA